MSLLTNPVNIKGFAAVTIFLEETGAFFFVSSPKSKFNVLTINYTHKKSYMGDHTLCKPPWGR